MKKWYVYILRRPDGQPFYVGKGTGKRSRLTMYPNGNPHKGNVIKKIQAAGEKVHCEIVWAFDIEDNAYKHEMKLIAEIGRHPHGPLTNMTDGGDGMRGVTFSPETRGKISDALRGKPRPDEVRKKISKAHSGKKIAPEHAAKIAASNTGKKRSPEFRAAMSALAKGRPKSPEHRAKLSAALRGKPLSEETKIKLRAAKRRKGLISCTNA